MKLKNIIKPGIIIGGIGAFAAGEASAEGLQPWQIDSSNKNQITVHVKRGDTLGEITNYLDKQYGDDNPSDAAKNLIWHLRDGDIFYSDCKNSINNPNIIEAGRDVTFKGRALEQIDPNYGKTEARKENYKAPESIENKTNIAKKDVNNINSLKTENEISESKTETPKKWGRSLKSDFLEVNGHNKENNFVINGSIEYGIFQGLDSEFGEGAIIDLSAGYEMPEGLGLLIGGRTCEINGNEYYRYKNGIFGFPYEAELDLGALTMTELYAEITAGNKNFRGFLGYGIKNVGTVDAKLSYGWWEGEGGIERDYGPDRFKGAFGGLELIISLSENLSAGIKARYGEYSTNSIFEKTRHDEHKNTKLELKETSAGVTIKFRF